MKMDLSIARYIIVLVLFCGYAKGESIAKSSRTEEPVTLHNTENTNMVSPKLQKVDQVKLDNQSVKSSYFNIFSRTGDMGFIHAFVASISVIVVSELGDKTFFIAAILAMHHSRLVVFLGAMSALFFMTAISAFLGFATTVIPRIYIHYVSTALFAIFGLKMLKDGYYMSPLEEQAEYEEVQKTITSAANESSKEVQSTDAEKGINRERNALWWKRKLTMCLSRVFLESFTMTFLGEWGDRSQLTTAILAAREDTIGVTLGALVGHGGCTSLAVVGGRFIAQRISVRTVTILGGVTFIAFAVAALLMGPG